MIKVYFDGACEPVNPGGFASYGLVIFCSYHGELYRTSKLFRPIKGHERETSNNVAEYSAFLHALEWLDKNAYNDEKIIFFGDSKLVIEQMFGSWKMRGGFYIPIALKAKQLLKKFTNITGQWIPREQNDIADKLSKESLIEAGVKFKIQPI